MELNRKILNHVCPPKSQRIGQLPQFLQSEGKISVFIYLEKSIYQVKLLKNHYSFLGRVQRYFTDYQFAIVFKCVLLNVHSTFVLRTIKYLAL